MTRTEALAALHNRATRYELAAIKGETRILIAYTCRRSRSGLLDACRKRADAVLKLTSPATEISFGKNADAGATIGDWTVRFTGRTQREAIMSGELPWIGAQVAEVANA